MKTYYFQTSFLPVTNTKGARVRVARAGSNTHVITVPFRYEIGGGVEQHFSAMRDGIFKLGHGDLAKHEVAFATKSGYVFRVETEDAK